MLQEVVVGISSGVVSGLGSTLISFHIWRAQRLWERRASAYKQVLEALQAMKAANDEMYDAEICGRTIREERQKKLTETWLANKVVAYRFADIGSVETDERVESILNTLRKEIEDHAQFHSYFEDLDNDGAATGKALRAVKEVALEDARASIFRKVPGWLSSVAMAAVPGL